MTVQSKENKDDKRDLLVHQYSDREIFKRLLGYMRPHWYIFTLAIIALFIGSFLTVLQPLIIKSAIDDYILEGKIDEVYIIAFFYLFLRILGVFNFIEDKKDKAMKVIQLHK